MHIPSIEGAIVKFRWPTILVMIAVAALVIPFILPARVSWQNYVRVEYGMSYWQAKAILGFWPESVNNKMYHSKNHPNGVQLRVYRWWGAKGIGRIDIGIDDDGVVRWKNYDPEASDSRRTGIRDG